MFKMIIYDCVSLSLLKLYVLKKDCFLCFLTAIENELLHTFVSESFPSIEWYLYSELDLLDLITMKEVFVRLASSPVIARHIVRAS